jgi:hypothetical protein
VYHRRAASEFANTRADEDLEFWEVAAERIARGGALVRTSGEEIHAGSNRAAGANGSREVAKAPPTGTCHFRAAANSIPQMEHSPASIGFVPVIRRRNNIVWRCGGVKQFMCIRILSGP